MSPKQIPREEGGFSLIEVMVAIVVLTIGLLSLAQTMVVATNTNAVSGWMTGSAALAREQLELLKAVPFYSDPAAFIPNTALLPGGSIDQDDTYFQYYDLEGQPVAQGEGVYVVRWTIEAVPTPGLPLEMLKITVRCTAAQEGGQNFFIGDATYVTFRTANVG